MSEFAGNVTGANENPVVSASKGEYFVPNDTGKSGAALKWLLIAISIIALFIGICLLSSHIDYIRSMPPEIEKLSAKLGQPMEAFPWTTKSVKYADVPFDINLVEVEGKLTEATYVSGVAVGREGVFSVAGRLLGRYGEPDDFSQMALTVLTEEDLQSLHSAAVPEALRELTWTWELNHLAAYYDGEPHYVVCMDLCVYPSGEHSYKISLRLKPQLENGTGNCA